MGEGTTSWVMAADRPYGEFYEFYSVSPEYFGYHHVHDLACLILLVFKVLDQQLIRSGNYHNVQYVKLVGNHCHCPHFPYLVRYQTCKTHPLRAVVVHGKAERVEDTSAEQISWLKVEQGKTN
jgi:hypothetical protein